jgi:hypothetical protein
MNIKRVILVFRRLRWRSGSVLAAVLMIGLFVSVIAMASTAQGYAISWWTVDGGGATVSTGGGYSLGSTIGQPDAEVLVGGSYTLAGGFWSGTGTPYRLYLPLVVRQS